MPEISDKIWLYQVSDAPTTNFLVLAASFPVIGYSSEVFGHAASYGAGKEMEGLVCPVFYDGRPQRSFDRQTRYPV